MQLPLAQDWSSKPVEDAEGRPREVRFLCSTEEAPPRGSSRAFRSAQDLHRKAPDAAPEKRRQDPLERFMAKTRREPSGCLVWTAFRSPKGYGRFQASARTGWQAHRWIYEQTVGPIGDLTLDHLCRNRACVEVTHLEPVTAVENTMRGFGPTAINSRRTHCILGHPLSGENLQHHRASHQRRCATCNRNSAYLSKVRKAGVWGAFVFAVATAGLKAPEVQP